MSGALLKESGINPFPQVSTLYCPGCKSFFNCRFGRHRLASRNHDFDIVADELLEVAVVKREKAVR